MSLGEYTTLGVALLGGSTIGAIGVKLLSRDIDSADAQQKRAAAQKDDVDSLREIIAEVKEKRAEEKAEAAAAAAVATTRIDRLEERLTKLEERERHMLTRAAVHESWDIMSFALLKSMHPDHPEPPPLAAFRLGDTDV